MTGECILVADDDRAIRVVLDQALGRLGYRVRSTDKAATLWQWIGEGEGDLVITDVLMPDGNGLDLIPSIRKLRPDLRIIAMSAQNTLLTAVRAAERGAFDYVAKPFDLNQLTGLVERALRRPGPAEPIPSAPTPGEALPLIGRSPAMQEIYRVMARLMTTDLTVMIFGESGTGKELAARALHDYGKRRQGPFIAINMAAIPRDLIESDLFGHEKGAFTGAVARGIGRFEQAAGGTLFLDEIGDMPLDAQTRLLRVLQQGELTIVGGRLPIKADVRIIAATHRDLRQAIRQGQFREDLYYRLNVVPIRLPPLRERSEDVIDLARHFLAEAAPAGETPKALDAAAQQGLRRHSWPGNVRELENLMRRIAVLYSQPVIGADIIESELAGSAAIPPDPGEPRHESLSEATEWHLRQYFAAHRPGLPASGLYERVLREIERPLLGIALEATRGNQIKAAELLGINRNTLRKKIRELDIEILRGLK
ncbi:MAG: two-component system, NtrC family, nitrogen regulation response regulator GlnG [Rhodospirillaceae bacterium]|nr:two-component system, NtrC family, nitrogen regulation response regulator GlnG [Rhodospirillaceae bacterium]